MAAVPAISAEALRVEYMTGLLRKKHVALKSLDLVVEDGEIFGYLGPNGAGKTTTIKCLVGVAHPAAGRALIFGKDALLPENRLLLGYSPENPYFYEYLTGAELLDFYGRLSGLSREERRSKAAAVLERVGLKSAADMRVGEYSKGMRQRFGLAQAVIHRPKLVILDEPMSGLDPAGRRDVREFIRELRSSGSTIFFSTHILSDVETICDHVGVLHRGELIAKGELTGILDAKVQRTRIEAVNAPDDALAWLGAEAVHREGNVVSYHVDGEIDAAAVMEALHSAGGRLIALTPEREDLESAFMRLTGLDREETAGNAPTKPQRRETAE